MIFFFSLCLAYYLSMVLRAAWFWRKARALPPASSPASVSVIIPARNEAAGLSACLQSILAQQYPGSWEVILVDDHSSDASPELARGMTREHPRLRVLDLQEGKGKKAALQAGIALAQGEIILQTDADCQVGPHWLEALAAAFSPETVMVSGPVLLTHDGSWFQQLQSLEYQGLVALGAGSLLAGRPNMANGANLAFRKQAFEAVGGYAGIDQVASGDDELLLQKMRETFPRGLAFAKNRAAIVRTPAQHSCKAFRAQRLRWVSKARAYRNRWINLTQLVSFFAFLGLAWVSVGAFFQPTYRMAALLFWGTKFLIDGWLMFQAAAFFHTLRLLRFFPLLQLLYLPYVLWIGIAGNVVNTYTWKDRLVR